MNEENKAPEVPKTKTPQDELANKLCIISIICFFAPGFISALIAPFGSILEAAIEQETPLLTLAVLPINAILGLSPIAAITLMIVARTKAPKNTFAKALMWVYIAFGILIALAVLAVLVFAVFAMASCANAGIY